MKHKYDREALKRIDIRDVLLEIGAEEVRGKNFRCFNKAFHAHGDKSPSMSVKKGTNTCKCFACGVGGDTISVVQNAMNLKFEEACEWLSYKFGIACLDSEIVPKSKYVPLKTEVRKTRYFEFKNNIEFKNIDLIKWIEKYSEMTISQKLKMVYSYIYRYSLSTNQSLKYEYYKSRGIEKHSLLEKIGFISRENLKELLKQLEKHFPIQDLIKFKLYNDAESKCPLQWKYGEGDLLVVPSFDLYTDMSTGFMLRPIKKEKWMPKEFQVSCHDICNSFPFAMSYDMFNNQNNTIYFTEGHVDGLSLVDKCFVAIPGAQGYKIEWLGLFKNRKCVIAFDMDKAGQDGADKLRAELLKAGAAQVNILTWNPAIGKDLNELLKSNTLKYVLQAYKMGASLLRAFKRA